MTIDNKSNQDTFEDESLNTGSDRVYQNYMMPGLELYDARVTINHWQLRDCIKPYSKDPSRLYYIYDHSIRTLDTDPSTLSQNDLNTNTNDNNDKAPFNSKYANKLCRRHSIYNNTSSSSNPTKVKSSLYINFKKPSKKLVEFNFKPRCFTELDGLTACGGLIGSDDKGFPTNWNRLSHETNGSNSPIPSPAQPINIASTGVLTNNTNYSNSSIWKGILSLYNENLDLSLTLILGQFINNCVTLFQNSTNNYSLYACNNDSHIYQCNISNRDVQLLRRYSDLKFPLNNAALSHDGKTMVVSGDSNKFALYRKDELTDLFTLNYDPSLNWDLTDTNRTCTVKRQTRFNVPDPSERLDSNIYTTRKGDHGFYNCFSENDLQFATLFQNGICLIYDIRNTEQPLAEITSTRPNSHNGSFRVCRFSYGLDDLLFISEHQGRVHIVDTRNFDNHQVIMIPDTVQTIDNSMKQNKTHETVVSPIFFNNDPVNNNNNSNSRRTSIYPLLPTGTDSLSPSMTNSTSSLFGNNNNNSNNNNNNNNNNNRILPNRNNVHASNTKRRFSAPSSTKTIDPWITQALTIPIKYLEPEILPFPRVFDRTPVSHRYGHYQYGNGTMQTYTRHLHHPSNTSVDSSSYSFSSSDAVIGEDYTSHNQNDVNYGGPNDNRNTFRVRRFSTTSNNADDKDYLFDDKDNFPIDPEISTSDNVSGSNGQRVRNSLFDDILTNESRYLTRQSRGSGNNDYMNSNDDTFYSGPFEVVTNTLYHSPTYNERTVLNFPDNEFGEENNISGIDWIQDRNGSSLIIGTDYGIIKWNINSWARRSFSSYDFC